MALLVNAFDFRETDNNPSDDVLSVEGPSRCSTKKLFRTRKSRLFVAKYREPFRLYELQVLESSHCSDVNGRGSLAICEAEGTNPSKESYDIPCKGEQTKNNLNVISMLKFKFNLFVMEYGSFLLFFLVERPLHNITQNQVSMHTFRDMSVYLPLEPLKKESLG